MTRNVRARPLQPFAIALRALLIASVFALGVIVGDLGGDGPARVAARAACDADAAIPRTSADGPQPAARRVHRARERGFVTRPTQLYVARDDAAEAEYRKRQSKQLVDLLRRSVARAEKLSPPGSGAEYAANGTLMYMTGWTDSLVRTAPDLLDELAGELEATLCDPAASDAQLIVMSRVINQLPELANAAAFDCLFSRRTQEDEVLWAALDAFGASGLPRTPALAQLERLATDPRTLERFEDPRARLLERGAAPAAQATDEEFVEPSVGIE